MRRISTNTRRLLFLTLLTTVVLFGTLTVLAKGPHHPPVCECANIYLPVVCDDGVVYYNPCVADCAHATGCVPTGGGGGIP